MYKTPTPLDFRWNSKKGKGGSHKINEEIYKKIKPIFEKSLQETLPNSMTTTKTPYKFFIRFNNYRRQIKVKNLANSTPKRNKGTMGFISNGNINISKHTGIVSIKDFMPQVTIQIGKETITGIWHQNIINGKKDGYVVEANSIEDICEWVDKKKEEINNSIDTALKKILKLLKLPRNFKPKSKRKEIEIKGEEYIDKLPKHLIIHDTVFKKVYEKGVEFKDEVNVKNFIKNRALEQVSPQIAEQLVLIDKKMDLLDKQQVTQAKAMDYYNRNIIKHFEVLSKMSKTLDRMNTKLSQKNLSEWL